MDTFLRVQKVPVITPHGNEFISFTHNRSYVGPSQKFGPFVSEAYELYVHVEGTCNILIEDRIFSPKCGDLFLYPIRRPHNLITKSDIYERFVIFFSPHVFDSIVCDQPLLRLFDTNEAGRNHVMLPGDVCQEIMRKLRQASEAIQSGAPDLPYLIYSEMIRILISVSKQLRCSSTLPLGTNCPLILSDIVDYIHANYRSIEGLPEVYERFGISRAYLAKIFKRYTVVTPYHYIRDLKLSHAKELLARGANVTEACFEAGFSDYSNFIRLFRTETGISPLAYRSRIHQTD